MSHLNLYKKAYQKGINFLLSIPFDVVRQILCLLQKRLSIAQPLVD